MTLGQRIAKTYGQDILMVVTGIGFLTTHSIVIGSMLILFGVVAALFSKLDATAVDSEKLDEERKNVRYNKIAIHKYLTKYKKLDLEVADKLDLWEVMNPVEIAELKKKEG